MGALIGGAEGRALVELASAWMKDEGIESPEGYVRMLAPGFVAR
jgi:hypothetical protein